MVKKIPAKYTTDPYLEVLARKETPVAVGIFSGKDHIITFANPLFCVVSGKTYEKIINKPLWHAIPEAQGQGFEKLLETVLTTGVPYIGSETPVKLHRKGKLETAYFSFVFNPLRNIEEKITDIMVVATEVTDKVLKEQAAESERQHFYELLLQAPAVIVIFKGPKHIIEFANLLAVQTIGLEKDIIGKPLIEVMPEFRRQPFIRILNNVYKTKESFIGNEIPAKIDIGGNGILEQRFYNFVYQPIINNTGETEGVFLHAVDVTEQVLTHQKIKENEKQLWDILESISDAFIAYDDKWRYVYINKAASKVIGKSPEELVGKVIWKISPRSKNTESGRNFLKAARTKKTIFFQTYYPPLKRWFDVRIYPRKNGLATTFRDITKEKRQRSLLIAKRDLRVPVTSLTLILQGLQHNFPNNEKSAELLEKMNEQINVLKNLLHTKQKMK